MLRRSTSFRLPAHLRLRELVLVLGLAAPWAQASVTVTGSYGLDPWSPVSLNGPNLSLPSTTLWLGYNGNASFEALAGSIVDLAELSLGQTMGALTTGLLDGQGTTLVLRADGNRNRFEVGNHGGGSFTVSGGALLDGRAEGWKCLQGHQYCNNFVGNAAGSDGLLTVTGNGSEARFQNGFVVANINVNNTGFGVPGGTTTGRVKVLDGARLFSDDLSAGVSWLGPGSNGQERSLAFVQIAGANSLWEINGRELGTGHAYAHLGIGERARAELTIEAGGVLRLKPGGSTASLDLGSGGGRAELTLDAGRVELLASGHNFFGVGREGTSLGKAWLRNGAVVQLVGLSMDTQIGQGQGHGEMSLSNAKFLMDASQGSALGLGIEGGNGALTLSNGSLWRQGGSNFGYTVVGRSGGRGQLEILGASQFETGALDVGSGQDARGTIRVDGVGSVLQLNRVNAHRLALGDSDQGSLIVSGGALLDASVNAADCAFKWCGIMVGHAAGSSGQLTVTGAGSEARFISGFHVAGTQVATLALDGWTIGAAGASTHGRVEVLDGGLLISREMHAGVWDAKSANGEERSFASGLISGAGSRWLVNGSALDGGDAHVNLANNVRSFADWTVRAGGALLLQAPAGRDAVMELGQRGQAVVTVQGKDSRVELNGVNAWLALGKQGGSGSLSVSESASVRLQGSANSGISLGESAARGELSIASGGQVSGARTVNVGSGGTGTLLIDGSGSLLTTDRNGSFVGQLNVGLNGSGKLTVSNGGAASAFSLQVGSSGLDNSSGEVLLQGVGSRIETDAVSWHRFRIDKGSMTVAGGAVLDAAVNPQACGGGQWCGAFLSHEAGDRASFTVTGAGSRASFISTFNAGSAYATRPPANSWSSGQPGQDSQLDIRVLDGGLLETGSVRMAQGPNGDAVTGSEATRVRVLLDGAGSIWAVRGTPDSGGNATFYAGLGQAQRTQTDIQILHGAKLQLSAADGAAAGLQLGQNGGQHRMLVSGAGSTVEFTNPNNNSFSNGVWVGRFGAQASLSFADGAQLLGPVFLQVGGINSLNGTASFSGAATRAVFDPGSANLYVGRSGGVGSMIVSDGAQLQMLGAKLSGARIGDGSGGYQGTSGVLTLDGAGTVLKMETATLAAGAGTNPFLYVGTDGNGVLQIRNGAQLLMHGQISSVEAKPSYTWSTVGNATSAAATGLLSITGAGSALRMSGVDQGMDVGRYVQGTGKLNLSDQAELSTTLLRIGNDGGSGQMRLDNASITLSGQWTNKAVGAALVLGAGETGSGVATLSNGASILISNPTGSDGAHLTLGGRRELDGGSGVLNMSGGSVVHIVGGAGLATANIGRTGLGLASLSEGSRLLVDDGAVTIGYLSSAVGTMRLSGGSQLQSKYVGVGATPGVDTGVGTLIVGDGSVVAAERIEIGARGYVGGIGTIVGAVTNRGVFNPGMSPGTLHIDGSFVNQAGGRLVLEVQDDGHGGFVTDHLIFSQGSSVDLGGLQINFRFLGQTDPNAFQASGGFGIGHFLQQQTAGGLQGLDNNMYSQVSFSATADAYQFQSFNFTAAGGAVFVAQAVPEPASWAMLLLGLGVLLRRRVRSS